MASVKILPGTTTCANTSSHNHRMNLLIFRWKTSHELVHNFETILVSRADASFWNLYGVTGLRDYQVEMANANITD